MNVTIHIPFELPLCVCPYCEIEHIVIAVLNREAEWPEEQRYMAQTNLNKKGMFCPYCGKNSREVSDAK